MYTNNNKKFFIRKNSTLPILKYPITQKIMEHYGIVEDMFENCAVTFSMVDNETDTFFIANVPAELMVIEDRVVRDGRAKYTLSYKFKEFETRKAGRFGGEFVVDFMGEMGCGKIKFPITEQIDIIVSDSITKTTVI